ncbi:hypothetical protein JKP88DRAFT_256260 [Tribonema minus]|uniref:Uncharacterized protein n=1 Tax=Tribonema minus TaxID=303371 RepID=A0A835YQR2_9STRA|nr:hypothetical protein JKP88DRAFT_256260 [Tribonema minus]
MLPGIPVCHGGDAAPARVHHSWQLLGATEHETSKRRGIAQHCVRTAAADTVAVHAPRPRVHFENALRVLETSTGHAIASCRTAPAVDDRPHCELGRTVARVHHHGDIAEQLRILLRQTECGRVQRITVNGLKLELADIPAAIRINLASGMGSVLDVIRLVNPEIPSNQASSTFKRVATELPDMASSCCQLRINGNGKLTPCADARTLVEIVGSLPGKPARAFRRTSATTVCRVLGGDVSLVDEIEGRCRALQATEMGRAAQDFLIGDGSDQVSRDLPAELQLATPEQRTFFGVADARDRIAFGDLVRRVVQPPAHDDGALIVARPMSEDDPSVATPSAHVAHRGPEISMQSVAAEMGVRIKAGTECLIGKKVKALYAIKYGTAAAAAIPKRNITFRGQIFAENTYWKRNQDHMEEAISTVTMLNRRDTTSADCRLCQVACAGRIVLVPLQVQVIQYVHHRPRCTAPGPSERLLRLRRAGQAHLCCSAPDQWCDHHFHPQKNVGMRSTRHMTSLALAELLQKDSLRDPKLVAGCLQQHRPDICHDDTLCARRTGRKTCGNDVVKNSSMYKAGLNEAVERAEQMVRSATGREERAWAGPVKERVIGFDELSICNQRKLKARGRLEQTAARSYTGSVVVDRMLADLVRAPESAELPGPPAGTAAAASASAPTVDGRATTQQLHTQGNGCAADRLSAAARALMDDTLATVDYSRPKVFELVCALAFMCGRSLAELMATGQFSAAERERERAPYPWVLFQASPSSKTEAILLLCGSHSFLNGLKRLRTINSAKTTSKQMSEWTRRCVPNSNLPSTAKFLAACNVAYTDALPQRPTPLPVQPATAESDVAAAESEENEIEDVKARAGGSCAHAGTV